MVADCEYERTPAFRSFRRQLFHASISTILSPLRPAMAKPEVAKCPDDHFQRVIYTLSPYIADYPEQVLLTGIVTGWCPKYVHLPSYLQYLISFRCTAPSSNLDTLSSPPRSQAWTDLMIDNLDRKELWDDCGINPDVVVSKSTLYQHVRVADGHPQTFTRNFPHADIHELISCDLLHQIIKGTFKDHLITWVGEYLEDVHGKSKAAKIMANIDQR